MRTKGGADSAGGARGGVHAAWPLDTGYHWALGTGHWALVALSARNVLLDDEYCPVPPRRSAALLRYYQSSVTLNDGLMSSLFRLYCPGPGTYVGFAPGSPNLGAVVESTAPRGTVARPYNLCSLSYWPGPGPSTKCFGSVPMKRFSCGTAEEQDRKQTRNQ